jgi:hypothetical protein
MESMNDINKALKIGQLNEINTCLKRYGLILKDVNVEKTNRRYTLIKYRNYYFRIAMQHGETLEITKSKYELQLI